LEVDFPHSSCNWKEDYPELAPQLRFTERRKIYHCNVDENGFVHLDILKSKYNKDVGISKILEAVYAMFANPDLDGAVCPGVALNYREDRATHDKLAREWACGSNCPQPVDVASLIEPPPIVIAPLDYHPVDITIPGLSDPWADMQERIQRDAVARYVGIEYNEAPTLV